MELGEKLRLARLEAGLTQRQLCGDTITRNMLSQIESGKAGPSVATLQYLARQLGKPVSFFLEEDTAVSANIAPMQRARQAYAARNYEAVLQCLSQYQGADPLFDEEYSYLLALASLEQAGRCLEQGAPLEAEKLLEKLPRSSIYYREEMERRRKQLLRQTYEQLEQDYKNREDFRQAYQYACKARTLSPR